MALRIVRVLAVIAVCFTFASPSYAQCVSLTTLGSAYSESFNTLGSTGTSSTVPTGWAFSEAGTNASTTYAAGTGSSTTGDTYSFGAAASTERAFGGLLSGSLTPTIGACFTNNTGASIASLQIAYTGEQWRVGGTHTAPAQDRIDFQYSTTATSLTTGTWTDVDPLDFNSPITRATGGALDGNAAANRTAISNTIGSLSIANGATFWIRWNDFNASGSDDGLAVDDFSLTPQASAPPLPNLTINDVSLNEGNAGTTTFTFTVSLSAPAGAGGVTFDIATADGTATAAADYTAKTLTGQTIPAGNSTYSFTVLVSGDTTPETNETFLVNVTNVSGASVTDGQGQGTIQNDDAAPTLTINDVTLNEGNAGTTTFTFTVSLDLPAPTGGVTFDIATADGTATGGSDYVTKTLTGQTIPTGSSTYTFDVLVNGDTTAETNETFRVNVTNITNAIAGDAQGLGTITNDDYTPIHDIQGAGATSTIATTSVTTRGIVTALRTNGFFLQEPDASFDANPLTSEGIFVFTSSAPPGTAVVGNLVFVTGTVQEFIPPSDPVSAPTTELSGTITVQLISSGNPLPLPILLTPADSGNLERYEGMRVTVTLDVVAPTDGFVNEPNATSTTNGQFYGVISGVARPYREPGINISDPVPLPNPPNVPRFDENFERIRVDSDTPPGRSALEVGFGQQVTMTGPVDFAFRVYNILPDPGSPVVTGSIATRAASAPAPNEFTVATANLQRFYNDVNDPDLSGSNEPILTGTAFANRLAKASIAIRNFLNTPDVVGVQEMENVGALTSLANQINADAVTATQPNPNYVPYLVEGNDIGGIDVGFLVKTSLVSAGVPRVEVVSVTQYNKTETYIDPNTSLPATLNDRPPLVLRAIIHFADGRAFPVTVIVNHLRSLNGVADLVDGRVRAKRRAQAESLANLIQSFQTAGERVISVGDYNAFQFNDGFGDSIGTIKGTPTPADQVVLASSDLVNPDLINLDDVVPAAERYSYSFDGNAQALDHVLITSNLNSALTGVRYDHARINGDLPETSRNNNATAFRISDHDPAVGYFSVLLPGALSFSSTTYATSESTTTFNVTVTRTGGSDGSVGATYTISAGTASPLDFTAATGTITFANGETSKTFPVTINNDLIDEADQTVRLALSAPTGGATLGPITSAVLTIQDDDAAPVLTISDISAAEGDSGSTNATVTVTLTGATEQTVTVSYTTADGTAAARTDYSTSTGVLTFTPGVTSQTINVPIIGDIIDEPDETVLVNLSGAANATISDSQGIVTITDDDPAPTLSISDATVVEGNSGTVNAIFTVTLTGATSLPVSVSYATADGSANAGSDYSATSGLLTFNPGVTTHTVTVLVNGDTAFEGNETFTVKLSGASNATISDAQGTGTITDDDGSPTLVISDATVTEGNAGTTNATFTVTLAGTTTLPVTVNYATTDGSATTGSDYVTTNGMLTFNPGTTTQTINVPVNGDITFEGNETFTVNLSGASNATISDAQGAGTITDDDGAPTLVISDATVTEGNAGTMNATFTVTLAGTTSLPVTVNYATANGTATAGSDYAATSGTLTFAAGVTTQMITVVVNGDRAVEPNETFVVNLSGASNATITDAQGLGTITNDDAVPVADLTLSMTTTPANPTTGSNVTFATTVTNNGPATATNVVVTDTPPAGATFGSAASTSGSCSGTGPITCSVGTLANGTSATITVIVQLPATPGSFTNTASATSDDLDANGATASATVSSVPANAIPAMSEWMLMLLACALIALAAARLRT